MRMKVHTEKKQKNRGKKKKKKKRHTPWPVSESVHTCQEFQINIAKEIDCNNEGALNGDWWG